MKVVAFNGSPRRGGNTERLLNHVLGPIRDAGIATELVQIGGQALRGCRACGACMETRNCRCIIGTDAMNDYIGKMVDADAILMGSPSYFSGMTSELKALIDRAGFVAFANGGLFARKIGAAVAVHRRGGAVNVVDSINHLFLMSRMIVPGSTYWNFGVGLDPGDIENDEEALVNMRDLGETIVWMLKGLARPEV